MNIQCAMVESIQTDSTVTINVSSESDMENVVDSLLAASEGEADSFVYPSGWANVRSKDGWYINVVIEG